MPPDSTIPNIPQTQEWLLLAPEMFLAFWGLVVLLVDVAFFRNATSARRCRFLGMLALDGTLLALVPALLRVIPSPLNLDMTVRDLSLFGGTIAGDASTAWLNLIVLILLALVLALSTAWTFTEHWGEFYALVIWAAVGMMVLIAAEELLTLFLALEMMTICLYMISAFETGRKRSAESGLKYFVYGAVASALFLFGLSLLYGFTGTTRIGAVQRVLVEITSGPGGLEGNVAGAMAVLLILVGFGFKVAAVPFHQWAPDVYEGAPAPAAAWIAAGSKFASFVALLKVLSFGLGPWAASSEGLFGPGWVGVVALISAVSMTYGNFAALGQRNFKRLLAYSSVAHAGYVLVGVVAAGVSVRQPEAVSAVLYYVVTYAFATIGAFAVASWLAIDAGADEIDDLDGLGKRRPVMAACLVMLMLSLIGLPPFAGFFGKLAMFMQALDAGETGKLTLAWLVGLGLLNSAVSAFYYVRVLKAMYLRPARGEIGRSLPSGVFWPVLMGALVVLGFGLYPSALLDPMKAAAVPLLTEGDDIRGGGANPRFATEADPETLRKSLEENRIKYENMKGRLQGVGAPG